MIKLVLSIGWTIGRHIEKCKELGTRFELELEHELELKHELELELEHELELKLELEREHELELELELEFNLELKLKLELKSTQQVDLKLRFSEKKMYIDIPLKPPYSECTCMPRYSGNGENCTGDYILLIFLVLTEP